MDPASTAARSHPAAGNTRAPHHLRRCISLRLRRSARHACLHRECRFARLESAVRSKPFRGSHFPDTRTHCSRQWLRLVHTRCTNLSRALPPGAAQPTPAHTLRRLRSLPSASTTHSSSPPPASTRVTKVNSAGATLTAPAPAARVPAGRVANPPLVVPTCPHCTKSKRYRRLNYRRQTRKAAGNSLEAGG